MGRVLPPIMLDISFMARAIELAKKGLFTTDPNPRVGAVLVKEGQIIGEGWHQKAGEAHAEVIAIANAKEQQKQTLGATCYVTLEPCSHHGLTAPCADALILAGINRVVIAMQDPNPKVQGQGIAKLKAAQIEVEVGMMEQEARALNPGFIQRMTLGRPYVMMKLAMSLDGRTAMQSGESQWISSAESREDVQRLRARVSAILTGSETVLHDNPRMTVRAESLGYQQPLCGKQTRQPLRVVIDGQQRLTPESTFFNGEAQALIFLPIQSEKTALFKQQGVLVEEVAMNNGHLDLEAILYRLSQNYQVNELMIEAGAQLSGALLKAGWVDQLEIYMAPKILGDNAKGLFHLPEIDCMKDVKNMQFSQVRSIGPDLKITCHPLPEAH